MRKLIFTAFFVAAGTTAVLAQNLNDIKEKIDKNKFGEAREKIDKAASDPKTQTSSEYWYYKAKTYHALGSQNGDTALLAGSLDAIRRYYEIESKQKEESKRALMAMLDRNHQLAFDIYQAQFRQGATAFDAKQWAAAERNFARALDAFEVLSKNNLHTAPMDTTTTLYAGYAAQNAQLDDAATRYYSIIADKRMADTNYIGLYEFLVIHYNKKKDAANTAKYLALGKELFPQNPLWARFELEDLEKDKTKKLAKLAELTQNSKDASLWLEYAFDLFNFTYGSEKPADYTARQQELTRVLETLTSLDETNAFAHFIMAQHVSNSIYDLQQANTAIKGTKPEDVKKKQAIQKDIDAQYELLFKYASNSANAYAKKADIKGVDKENYRKMLNEIADYYKVKKQADKAKEFTDKAKAL